MKIGIITFWTTQDNYGQIAQLYAMQVYLRKLGHDPYLIRYIDKFDKPLTYKERSKFNRLLGVILNPQKIFFYLKNKKNAKITEDLNNTHNRFFDEFKENYIKKSEVLYNSFNDLKHNPPEADVYICGSDMIWNEFVTNEAYLLNFGQKNIKKIAFAPSFAKSSVSNDFIDKLKPFIKNFDYVGVREKSGIEICKKAGYANAEWVPDPTMLLTQDDYIKDLKLKDSNEKYIFVYLLGYELELDIDDIYKFANARNLKVRYVASQFRVDSHEKIYPRVEDWFEEIKNAEYIFTNSFHCCVISLIFNKNFLFIPLLGHTSENNERIYSLFSDFSIDREYKGDILKIDEEMNWELINENFNKKQERINSLFSTICT